MLGPQDERTLMLNAKSTHPRTPGKGLSDTTFTRDVRTVNNRTWIDKDFGCKFVIFKQDNIH